MPVLLGLVPLLILCLACVIWMAGVAPPTASSSTKLTALMTLLFATTLAFAYYALSRYPSLHQLPAIWAILLLLEFVISPLHDIYLDEFGTGSSTSLASLSGAIIACTLFVIGLWCGLVVARYAQRRYTSVRHSQPPGTQMATGVAVPVILVFALVSLSAQIYVLLASGAVTDLATARGEGLSGTSIFTPVIRLANIATLLASQLAVVEASPSQRRKFWRLAILSAGIAMVMPIVLGQRFGILLAIAFLFLPKLGYGTWPSIRIQKLFLMLLPAFLVGAWVLNGLTSAVREDIMAQRDLKWSSVLELMKDQHAAHFRHLWLLSELRDKGIDEPKFGSLYDGTPILGDIMIVLPRALFPSKPITTMEVVNGVVEGDSFTALDRGKRSVYTPSLWVQLYLVGSIALMWPLSFVFGLLSMLLWGWASRRSNSQVYLIIATVFWLMFGWLAFNVLLTTMEIPGILLAVATVKLFPVAVRSQASPTGISRAA